MLARAPLLVAAFGYASVARGDPSCAAHDSEEVGMLQVAKQQRASAMALAHRQVPEGQQCGTSGSTSYFYGDCAGGLVCVPPPIGSPPGAPSLCHTQCGTFGEQGGPVVDMSKCSAGQTCTGEAETPCSLRDHECYMYCVGPSDSAEKTVGQECGSSGSTGMYNGQCAEGLVCLKPKEGSPPGTPSTCQQRQQKGQDCGGNPSTGYYDGTCGAGLVCVPPGASAPGTPSKCFTECGSFGGEDGDVADQSLCSGGETCSGKAATPCRAWAGECYMYCV